MKICVCDLSAHNLRHKSLANPNSNNAQVALSSSMNFSTCLVAGMYVVRNVRFHEIGEETSSPISSLFSKLNLKIIGAMKRVALHTARARWLMDDGQNALDG